MKLIIFTKSDQRENYLPCSQELQPNSTSTRDNSDNVIGRTTNHPSHLNFQGFSLWSIHFEKYHLKKGTVTLNCCLTPRPQMLPAEILYFSANLYSIINKLNYASLARAWHSSDPACFLFLLLSKQHCFYISSLFPTQ